MNALWGLLPFFLALLGLVPPLFLKGKERLSLLNHFPSETLREEPRKVRAIFLILSTLALFLFLIVPSILLGETSEGGTRSFLLLFVFLEALYASGYLGISVYHPSENRLHFASLGADQACNDLAAFVLNVDATFLIHRPADQPGLVGQTNAVGRKLHGLGSDLVFGQFRNHVVALGF